MDERPETYVLNEPDDRYTHALAGVHYHSWDWRLAYGSTVEHRDRLGILRSRSVELTLRCLHHRLTLKRERPREITLRYWVCR